MPVLKALTWWNKQMFTTACTPQHLQNNMHTGARKAHGIEVFCIVLYILYQMCCMYWSVLFCSIVLWYVVLIVLCCVIWTLKHTLAPTLSCDYPHSSIVTSCDYPEITVVNTGVDDDCCTMDMYWVHAPGRPIHWQVQTAAAHHGSISYVYARQWMPLNTSPHLQGTDVRKWAFILG